jgi:hypothetical protein
MEKVHRWLLLVGVLGEVELQTTEFMEHQAKQAKQASILFQYLVTTEMVVGQITPTQVTIMLALGLVGTLMVLVEVIQKQILTFLLPLVQKVEEVP